MRPERLVFLGLLAAASLGAAPESRPAEVVDRDAAREALRPICGSCHTAGLETSKEAALRVFDLAESDWAGRLSHAGLDALVKRVQGSDGSPEEGRKAVLRFVERLRALPASPTASGE